MNRNASTRNLVLVLGDQLDDCSAAFDGFDRRSDKVWMAEARNESEHVWSTKPRIVMFLSAMRHFRDRLRGRDIDVRYSELSQADNTGTLAGELERCVKKERPERLIAVHPGEHRVLGDLRAKAQAMDVPLEVRPDRSFLCAPEEFEAHVEGRKSLRMEFFYRQMRRKLDVLMDEDKPVGGKWNLDAENRASFDADGPDEAIEHKSFRPDKVTREVIRQVNEVLPEHPGSLESFDWPVTPPQAAAALKDFIESRLERFGPYQDAMWTGRPFLYHSRLSAALNLKLLDPRKVVEAAMDAFRDGRAPLNSVEGFLRQIIGWREYVRGVYWRFMPEYLDRNELRADVELPDFYWTGETEARCLREVLGQTLEFGYAHHIQRLMVTGLFALLLGVDPREVHRWYLAVYVDAVEWVELPNTLGMSQYADGGVMASKPYAASGKYIDRMSNYCRECRFRPGESTGEDACPFTTLYWDFLMRHEKRFADHPRMGLQVRNLQRLGRKRRKDIRKAADQVRSTVAG